jgi:DNA polymerase
MSVCHIDIESYSEAPLKKCGLYVYAEHQSTEILTLCYQFDEGPVNVWIPYAVPRKIEREVRKHMDEDGELYINTECPQDLHEHVSAGGECRAHNAAFERVMLNNHPGQDIGFPASAIEQWVCTAAKAAAMALPRHLEGAAEQLKTHRKDKVGKMDMMALCKPRSGKIKRYTPENAPDRFISMILYCCDDVRAEKGIDDAMPDLLPYEQKVFEMDQRINDRGIKVDIKSVRHVQELIKQYKAELDVKCKAWTGGIGPTKTAAISNWVRENGYPQLENLQAATVKEALKDPDCPREVRRVLQLRSIYSMKAVSKYTAIENALAADGRLHGMFMYHGAGTGRWSSTIVQLQNLFRPVIEDPDFAVEQFALEDLEWIRTLYKEDPMKVFASCVRAVMVPDTGADIIAMDYSAIEARVLAWLAGQEDILEVFRDHGKVYEYTAARIFHLPNDVKSLKAMKHTHPDERFLGKVAVLALGYQGGKAAFAKMAKTYGADIEENRAHRIKEDWRKANAKIVRLWYHMEELAIAAVANPGSVYSTKCKRIKFLVEDRWLLMRLPSGRRLAYYRPELDEEGKLTYLGIDTYTRRWMRCNTYGGKLTENAVQAIARDLLVNGMFGLEAKGYDIIGTVHDEVILEPPEDWGSEQEVAEVLCDLPKWADRLPVKAEGFRGKRYRK